MDQIVASQLKAYRGNFLRHGDSPQGTYQNNEVTIEERHRQLLARLRPFLPANFTLCDLGSGTCDLHGYLLKNGIQHRYTGVEIVPEMRVVAARKYPGIRLRGDNILDAGFSEKFDVVVASGTFNLRDRVEVNAWEKYVLEVVAKMFSLAKVGIAYNALTAYADFRADSLYYMSPELAVTHAQRCLSRFYFLSTLWPLFEFTLTVLRPEAVSAAYVEKEFDKYLPGHRRGGSRSPEV